MTETPSNTFDEQKDVKFITPPNLLKSKVGSGDLPKQTIEKGEQIVKTTRVDLLPYARKYLTAIEQGLEKIVETPTEFLGLKEGVIEPMMKIKGNCGMFHYTLLSDIAGIAMNFLETLEEWNEDAHQVMVAHIKTIKTIIASDMKGTGGAAGYALAQELHKACERYFVKHAVEK